MVAICLAAAIPAKAAIPDYAHEALLKFSTEVPKGWAYTLTTVRNDKDRTTARYDPSKPAASQWSLLSLNGRPPTESEAAQFARAGGGTSGPQASFQKADIDPASIELISEGPERAEFRARFRPEAAGADKMLAHLGLKLTIQKKGAYVEGCVLELAEPYSPVLWVKMRELRVVMKFSAPSSEAPGLPLQNTSHFVGRIFLIGMEENLALTYSEFAHVN